MQEHVLRGHVARMKSDGRLRAARALEGDQRARFMAMVPAPERPAIELALIPDDQIPTYVRARAPRSGAAGLRTHGTPEAEREGYLGIHLDAEGHVETIAAWRARLGQDAYLERLIAGGLVVVDELSRAECRAIFGREGLRP
jgi:hypothetical protein